MQNLYTLEAQEQTVPGPDAVRILQKHFDQTRQLFSYLIHIVIEIARYAETDSRLRASKHLPSAQDLNVNIKLAGNEFLWKMLEDESLKKALAADKPHLQENKEVIRKLYLGLVATEDYQRYIREQGRERKSERDMLEFIFSIVVLPNESFLLHVEEHNICARLTEAQVERPKNVVLHLVQRSHEEHAESEREHDGARLISRAVQARDALT